MNADSIGQLAARAGVKRLVVTHRYPPAMKVDLAAEIHRHYAGPVILAQDGTKVHLDETG
jgi:ribonuclease BN (tRNA processing enzyme)